MNPTQYIMQDQARNTVRQIMAGPVVNPAVTPVVTPIGDKLLLKPAWLGLILLVTAINLLTLVPDL